MGLLGRIYGWAIYFGRIPCTLICIRNNAICKIIGNAGSSYNAINLFQENVEK